MDSIPQDSMKLHMLLTVEAWESLEPSFMEILRRLPNHDRTRIMELAVTLVEQCSREASFHMALEMGVDPPNVSYPVSRRWLEERIEKSRAAMSDPRIFWTDRRLRELAIHRRKLKCSLEIYNDFHAMNYWGRTISSKTWAKAGKIANELDENYFD